MQSAQVEPGTAGPAAVRQASVRPASGINRACGGWTRTGTGHAPADPNTYSREGDRYDFLSTSSPPLTFGVRTDELSGITDGILKRPGIDRLAFQTDTEEEYYEFRISLNLTSSYGEAIDLPPGVRVYLLSAFQHGGNNPPTVSPDPPRMCQNSRNPNYYSPGVRALLLALDDWAERGVRGLSNAFTSSLATPERWLWTRAVVDSSRFHSSPTRSRPKLW